MKGNLCLLLLAVLLSFAVLVTAKSKGSKKQPKEELNDDYEDDAVPEDDYVATINPLDPESGKLIVEPSDPRVKAQELQGKIEHIHAKDSRDPLALAQLTLTQAFLNFSRGAHEVSVPSILKELIDSPPRTSMYIVRLLELLDRDNNFQIDVEEFQWTFSQPVTSTSLLIALFFKIQDYDSDGLISRYDLLNDELLSLGVNYNMFDMWRAVTQKLAEIDVNQDGLVNPIEHANYVLFQINRALVQRRDGTLN